MAIRRSDFLSRAPQCLGLLRHWGSYYYFCDDRFFINHCLNVSSDQRGLLPIRMSGWGKEILDSSSFPLGKKRFWKAVSLCISFIISFIAVVPLLLFRTQRSKVERETDRRSQMSSALSKTALPSAILFTKSFMFKRLPLLSFGFFWCWLHLAVYGYSWCFLV